MEQSRFWFEAVPEEGRYWALARIGTPQSPADESESDYRESAFSPDPDIDELMRRQVAVGFAPGAIEPELIQLQPDVYALVLYTTRQGAEEALREIEERDPDEYLRLKDIHGQEQTNQAYSNSAPYRVIWTNAELLLEQLKELELAALEAYGPRFETVVLDGQPKIRWDFTRDLEQRVQGY